MARFDDDVDSGPRESAMRHHPSQGAVSVSTADFRDDRPMKRDRSAMDIELAGIREELELLHQANDMLFERLSPVLQPERAEGVSRSRTEGQTVEDRPVAPVVYDLRGIRATIEQQRNLVLTATSLLDV